MDLKTRLGVSYVRSLSFNLQSNVDLVPASDAGNHSRSLPRACQRSQKVLKGRLLNLLSWNHELLSAAVLTESVCQWLLECNRAI